VATGTVKPNRTNQRTTQETTMKARVTIIWLP